MFVLVARLPSVLPALVTFPFPRADNAVSALRQQIPPDHRVHGVIKGTENYAQNIVRPPDTPGLLGASR